MKPPVEFKRQLRGAGSAVKEHICPVRPAVSGYCYLAKKWTGFRNRDCGYRSSYHRLFAGAVRGRNTDNQPIEVLIAQRALGGKEFWEIGARHRSRPQRNSAEHDREQAHCQPPPCPRYGSHKRRPATASRRAMTAGSRFSGAVRMANSNARSQP